MKKIIHGRRILFVKAEAELPPMFITVDRLTAEDQEQHSYEVMWHLHDNPTTLNGNTVNNVYEDGIGITVASSAGSMGLVRGQKTPVYQG